MKILFIVNELSATNGWSTYAVNVIQEAIKNEYEAYAVVEKKVSFESVKKVPQYPVLFTPLKALWNPVRVFIQWRRLKKIIKSIKPDIIHVITEPYILPFAFSFFLRVPIVLTVHGTYATLPNYVTKGFQRSMSEVLYNLALRRVKKVICVSKATKEKFLNFQSIVINKDIEVIHNSIQMPAQKSFSVRSDPEGYSIITVGEVKKRKGIHEAIPIFSNWAKVHKKKIVYHVVGFYDDSSEYVAMIRRLLDQTQTQYFSLIFHGRVDALEKQRLLMESSIYVHLERVGKTTTEVEGFGIGIVEAASYGVPALVAQGSATVEAVNEGVSGYSADLNNIDSFNKSIDDLLIKSKISHDTVFHWAEDHSTEVIFKKIEDIYNLCISTS